MTWSGWLSKTAEFIVGRLFSWFNVRIYDNYNLVGGPKGGARGKLSDTEGNGRTAPALNI